MAAPPAKGRSRSSSARTAAGRGGARAPAARAPNTQANAAVGNLQLGAHLRQGRGAAGDVGDLAHAAGRRLGRHVSSVGSASDADEAHADRAAQRWADRAPGTGAWTMRSDGGALSPAARRDFEAVIGADLSAARIHAGPTAHGAATLLQAAAFAHGSDVYVRPEMLVPGSAASGRLLAHELAHVAHDPTGTRVRRQLLIKDATDARNDENLLSLQTMQPGILILDEAPEIGGLVAWQKRMPDSYIAMRKRAVAEYGEKVIALLESNDAVIYNLVTKATSVIAQLLELREQVQTDTPEDRAALGIIEGYTGTRDMFSDSNGLYDISFSYFAKHLAQDSRFDLKLHQAILAGSVDDLVQAVSENAADAADEAHDLWAQRQAWTEAANVLLGQQAAHRDGIFADTSYKLASLRDPTWGSEDMDDMSALARLGGRSSAVMRVGKRYYTFDLDESFNRTQVFAATDWDQASLVIDDVVQGGHTVEIVTNDGFALNLKSGSEVMFGGSQTRNPLSNLEADSRLAQADPADRHGIDAPSLFESMVRNLALLNLQRSEERLNGIVGDMHGDASWGVDPARGQALKVASARLRELTMQSNALADEIGDKAPSDGQSDRRDDLMGELGQLVDKNPAAAFFVSEHHLSTVQKVFMPPLALLASAGGPRVIDDDLSDERGGDAASMAVGKARARLANIGKVRRAMFDDSDIVLGFQSLYPPVYNHFTARDKKDIQDWLDDKDTDQKIHSALMLGADALLLVAGFFTDGATWAAMGVEAVGVGMGMAQLQDQYAHMQLTMAMSAVDIPGADQLASEEAAASAQHWFWVSAGLNFLGVAGLTRTASRLMRRTAEDAALLGNLARRAGVTEEAMAGAFRTSWRGVRTPDPDALREIMLARLPPGPLKARYADIGIQVVDDATFAKMYPQNPMSNASIEFGVPHGGGVEAQSIIFRAGGNPMGMQEEAEHILQATAGEHAGTLQQLVVDAQDWATLSLARKLEATSNFLEVESNAQERLLARAQAEGDVAAMDDILEEMDDLAKRQEQLESVLRDPTKEPPDWFDPTKAPESLFSSPRLPRSHGRWSNPNKPGNSTWMPDRPDVKAIAPKGIDFSNCYPNFRPWKVYEVRINQAGLASDFGDADAALARRFAKGEGLPGGATSDEFIFNGEPNAAAVKRYRKAAGLTWHHHQGGTTMLLVPTKLHANVPHTGGASAARVAGAP
jgi:hypothetical protein